MSGRCFWRMKNRTLLAPGLTTSNKRLRTGLRASLLQVARTLLVADERGGTGGAEEVWP